MKNNETGEFELVLGNRQLLSGFFIVVILFAVFFVMGYIVGRNSAPSPQLASAQTNPATGPSSGRPQPGGNATPAQTPPASDTAKEETGTKPVSESQPPAPTRQREAKAETPATPPELAPGETYLQVTAVKQEVADTVARTLKEKGFPAVLSPGPSGKTRVLVGPYADVGKLGQAKAERERLGFSPFVKK